MLATSQPVRLHLHTGYSLSLLSLGARPWELQLECGLEPPEIGVEESAPPLSLAKVISLEGHALTHGEIEVPQ
jgi:hypothetical protein